MAELFNVVFEGGISGRADPAVVRANVGKLFNANEALLDRLFSGQPVTVKKMVDQATAMKIRALMKQAGADARIVPVDEQGRPLAPIVPVPVVPAAPPATTGTMATRVEALAAQSPQKSVGTSGSAIPPAATIERVETWALHPTGSPLSVASSQPVSPAPDISGISLVASGGALVRPEEIAKPAPVHVDISAISMAPAGTDVLKENERAQVEAVNVDISGMSVAEVGAPLDEIRDEKPPVKVDISHIKLQ